MSSNINITNNNMAAEENRRMENAHKVAAIVKNSNFPILKYPAAGSNKYFKSIAEKERARLLKNPEEMNNARVHGKSVAQLFKTVPRFEYHERPAYKGYWHFLAMLEEKERKRRINDRDEAVHRRMNALNISEGVRTQGTIIRARLVKRAPKSKIAPTHTTWESLSAAAHLASAVTNKAIHDAVEIATPAAEVAAHALSNAYESARHAVTSVPAIANKAVHNAVDAITPHSEPNKPSAISSLLNRAFAIKDSLVNTVQQAMGAQPIDVISREALSNIHLLEEMERERRVQEDPVDGCARSNARKMSQLLSHARFPTLRSGKGFKSFTNTAEERERLRRLANKNECECHRMNAHKIAGIVSEMGKPFLKEAGTRKISSTHALEEEERRRRMIDEKGQWSARYNAKRVSGLIKDASFPEQSKKAFMLDHTKKLEEKERKYRMKNCDTAVHNAHRQAQLIADMGSSFLTAKAKADVKEIVRQKIDRMEAEERMDRMSNTRQQKHAQKKAHKIAAMIANKELPKSKQERQLAQEFAHDVAHIQSTDLNMLEENERKSRMADKIMQQQARANANKVAGLMKKTFVKNNTGFGITANKPFPLASIPPATISPTSKQLAPYIRSAPIDRSIAHAQAIPPPVVIAQPQTAQISQPVPPQHAVSAPSIPFTQVHYKPSAPLYTPASVPATAAKPMYKPTTTSPATTKSLPFTERFNLKKSDSQLQPGDNEKLFTSVRSLYKSEMTRAEKEQEKINKLSGKSHGPFGRFRLQRHESNLAKARDNARRHEEWLRANAPAASAAL